MKLPEIHASVFDAGTYTSLDYDYIERRFADGYDMSAPKCTAVVRKTSAGEMLTGRNMDLNITNNPAYIVRTAVPGCRKTVGLMYTFAPNAPDTDEVRKNGISDDFARQLPFLSCDVLNDAGLYIEINMRTGEGDKFRCDGTNPGGKRVYVVMLSRYVGEHCATVEEALAYIRTLDLFTRTGGGLDWNFCFMMADASGRHGLLEVACDKVVWHEGQCAQTNFYVEKQWNAMEDFRCGLGRYDVVTKGAEDVETEDDMFRLIDTVTYHQVYAPVCRFDRRSEFASVRPHWTTDYLLADENQKELDDHIAELSARVSRMTRQEKQDDGTLWESTFTEVVNCTKKTMFVRFFEDDMRTVKLGFEPSAKS